MQERLLQINRMTDLIERDRPYLTTSQAMQRSGLTRSYLTYLMRNKKIEGFQLLREWFIYTDSLDAFLSTTRKPGPKGPRTPKSSPESE
jgi:hypothetical protein